MKLLEILKHTNEEILNDSTLLGNFLLVYKELTGEEMKTCCGFEDRCRDVLNTYRMEYNVKKNLTHYIVRDYNGLVENGVKYHNDTLTQQQVDYLLKSKGTFIMVKNPYYIERVARIVKTEAPVKVVAKKKPGPKPGFKKKA